MKLQSTELKMNAYEASEKSIKIGVATTKAEKEEIYQLRYQVYVEEMGKVSSRSANYEKGQIVDGLDDWSALLYAQVDSEIVGTLRVTIGNANKFPKELQHNFHMDQFGKFPKEKDLRQSLHTKLAVTPDYRSSQVTYLLVSKAYELCRDEKLQFMFGGCNPYLVALYERLGFRRFPQNFVDPSYGIIIPLVLVTEDIEHLRLVHSPFLRIARKRSNDQEAAKWFLREFPNVAKIINSQLISKDALWEYVKNRLEQSPIQAVHLLKGLSEEEAKSILHMGTIFHCVQGDYIVNRGVVAKELYVLLSGRVKVRSEVLISERVPGESFGRSGLMKPQVQMEDIYTTTTNSEVMVISQQSFEKLCRSHADIAAKVLNNMRNQEC